MHLFTATGLPHSLISETLKEVQETSKMAGCNETSGDELNPTLVDNDNGVSCLFTLLSSKFGTSAISVGGSRSGYSGEVVKVVFPVECQTRRDVIWGVQITPPLTVVVHHPSYITARSSSKTLLLGAPFITSFATMFHSVMLGKLHLTQSIYKQETNDPENKLLPLPQVLLVDGQIPNGSRREPYAYDVYVCSSIQRFGRLVSVLGKKLDHTSTYDYCLRSCTTNSVLLFFSRNDRQFLTFLSIDRISGNCAQ